MKKLLTVIFVALLMLMLVGCGGGDSHVGEVKTPSGSSEMKGLDYESVRQSFVDNGFTNIKLEKIEDLITGWLTKDGEVEKVSVGGDVDYTTGRWVPAGIEVIISYHTFPPESVATESIPEETPTQESQAVVVEEATEVTEQIEEILTIGNCKELASILQNNDEPYESYINFASKYAGRTIQFDGRIDYLATHENYNTRYDILVSAGDYDPNTQTGPTFKFEDVGLVGLGLDSPTITVGMNVLIVAEIEEFDYNTGIFFLNPISITER